MARVSRSRAALALCRVSLFYFFSPLLSHDDRATRIMPRLKASTHLRLVGFCSPVDEQRCQLVVEIYASVEVLERVPRAEEIEIDVQDVRVVSLGEILAQRRANGSKVIFLQHKHHCNRANYATNVKPSPVRFTVTLITIFQYVTFF